MEGGTEALQVEGVQPSKAAPAEYVHPTMLASNMGHGPTMQHCARQQPRRRSRRSLGRLARARRAPRPCSVEQWRRTPPCARSGQLHAPPQAGWVHIHAPTVGQEWLVWCAQQGRSRDAVVGLAWSAYVAHTRLMTTARKCGAIVPSCGTATATSRSGGTTSACGRGVGRRTHAAAQQRRHTQVPAKPPRWLENKWRQCCTGDL